MLATSEGQVIVEQLHRWFSQSPRKLIVTKVYTPIMGGDQIAFINKAMGDCRFAAVTVRDHNLNVGVRDGTDSGLLIIGRFDVRAPDCLQNTSKTLKEALRRYLRDLAISRKRPVATKENVKRVINEIKGILRRMNKKDIWE